MLADAVFPLVLERDFFMKKHIVLLLFSGVAFYPSNVCSQPIALNNITTERMRSSDQVRLMFSEALESSDYAIDTNNNQCMISLFNLPADSINQQEIIKKIKSGSRAIASVNIAKSKASATGIEGTIIKITFLDANTHLNFQVLENQFIIDIISPMALQAASKTSHVISQAHNGHGHAYAYYSVRQLV